MSKPALSISIILAVAVIAFALAISGCTNPLSGPAPSVTIVPTYAPPTFTPIPTVAATPTPNPTSWNGDMVKLYGNVTVKGGEHVLGWVKLVYQDKNYVDETPTGSYDTDAGGAYSIDVRGNVSFKVILGYTYADRLSGEMNKRSLSDTYTILNDTQLDFTVAAANATQVK